MNGTIRTFIGRLAYYQCASSDKDLSCLHTSLASCGVGTHHRAFAEDLKFQVSTLWKDVIFNIQILSQGEALVYCCTCLSNQTLPSAAGFLLRETH